MAFLLHVLISRSGCYCPCESPCILQGSVKNVLKWTLLDEDLDGRLEVACAYELDPKGRMNASLGGHRLLPDGKMPRDPQALVVLLQRAMPYELFDPSEHAFETTVRPLFVRKLSKSFRVLSREKRMLEHAREQIVLYHI